MDESTRGGEVAASAANVLRRAVGTSEGEAGTILEDAQWPARLEGRGRVA